MSYEYSHPRWEDIWSKGLQPGQLFDANSPFPILLQYVKEGLIPTGRALIPGCGRGYDVTALASNDRIAIGLEISPTAIEAARLRWESLPIEDYPFKQNAQFKLASFFDLSPSHERKEEGEKGKEHLFDFIYDYTFLCALDPSIRSDWARQMAKLVRQNGILMTLIYPINPNKVGGPPFAVSLDGVREILEPVGFECIELRLLPAELCHRGRDGSEGSTGASGVGRWRRI